MPRIEVEPGQLYRCASEALDGITPDIDLTPNIDVRPW
jgi:hypothetical protein